LSCTGSSRRGACRGVDRRRARPGEREELRLDRPDPCCRRARRGGRDGAAARDHSRTVASGGALPPQPRTGSSQSRRRSTRGAADLRAPPGQGDGGSAPPVPGEPSEDRADAEGHRAQGPRAVSRVVGAVAGLVLLAMGSGAIFASAQVKTTPDALGVSFENVAPSAGLSFTHVNGASPDKYLVETMGSGAVFFDIDDDGLIDVFVVDGGSIADRAVASKARHRLFRNMG